MEGALQRGNWVLANEWLHVQRTQNWTSTVTVIIIINIIAITFITDVHNEEKQNTKNSSFHFYHCVALTSTKCNTTCWRTPAKLQTYWQQGTQITPLRMTPNHGKQKIWNPAVFLAARARAWVSLDAAFNSKFHQAIHWCHTSHQTAPNTGTLRPEAHFPASCDFELPQRKEITETGKTKTQQQRIPTLWHCHPIGRLPDVLGEDRNKTQWWFDLLKRPVIQAPTSHPSVCVA